MHYNPHERFLDQSLTLFICSFLYTADRFCSSSGPRAIPIQISNIPCADIYMYTRVQRSVQCSLVVFVLLLLLFLLCILFCLFFFCIFSNDQLIRVTPLPRARARKVFSTSFILRYVYIMRMIYAHPAWNLCQNSHVVSNFYRPNKTHITRARTNTHAHTRRLAWWRLSKSRSSMKK